MQEINKRLRDARILAAREDYKKSEDQLLQAIDMAYFDKELQARLLDHLFKLYEAKRRR